MNEIKKKSLYSWLLFDLANTVYAFVISGLYLMANGAQYAAVEVWDEEYFQDNGTFQFLNKNDINSRLLPFTVEYVGFGFLLFKKG